MVNKKKAHKQTSDERRAAKKAAVLGTEAKSRMPILYMVIIAVLLVGGGAFYVIQMGKGGIVAESGSADVSSTAVSYPVEMFEDGKSKHFSFAASDDLTINFFILKSSDGVIRAAFDACDVCWPAGKGYYQEGDNMVCRNCGRRFASSLINVEKGGCNPAPLTRKVENGKLVIQIADLLEGKQYFNFAKKG